MEELMSLKATNGIIKIYEDRVVIVRKGFFAFASQGGVGDRIYYYSDMKTVEYKKPGMINGYIKFIVEGTNDINAKVNIWSSTKQSAKDPNTVILRAYNHNVVKQSQIIYELIMKKIKEYKDKLVVNSNFSKADEILKFKKLLEEGIITKEEFERKKQELLN